jgi:hypothetical protein
MKIQEIHPGVSAQASTPQSTVGSLSKTGADRKALKRGLEFAAMLLTWTGVVCVAGLLSVTTHKEMAQPPDKALGARRSLFLSLALAV